MQQFEKRQVEEYRKQAARSRQLAFAAANGPDRDEFLAIAQNWDALAREAASLHAEIKQRVVG